MAKPAVLNLQCVQGDDYEKPLRFRDKITQQVLNLTGWTGEAQIRNESDQLLTTFTILIDHAVAPGIVHLSLTDAVTSDLPVGKHLWDLELVNSLGMKRTYLKGTFKVTEQVTRPET